VTSSTRRTAWRAESIIHGYFDVNHDIVWDAAECEIPRLAEQVRAVLAAIDSDPLE